MSTQSRSTLLLALLSGIALSSLAHSQSASEILAILSRKISGGGKGVSYSDATLSTQIKLSGKEAFAAIQDALELRAPLAYSGLKQIQVKSVQPTMTITQVEFEATSKYDHESKIEKCSATLEGSDDETFSVLELNCQ